MLRSSLGYMDTHLEWMAAGLVRLPVLLLMLDAAVGHLVAVGALGLGGLLAHMARIHLDGGTINNSGKKRGKRWFFFTLREESLASG